MSETVVLDTEVVAFYERLMNTPLGEIEVRQYIIEGCADAVLAMEFSRGAGQAVLSTPMRANLVQNNVVTLKSSDEGDAQSLVCLSREALLTPLFGFGVHPCRNVAVAEARIVASSPVHHSVRIRYVAAACMMYRSKYFVYHPHDTILDPDRHAGNSPQPPKSEPKAEPTGGEEDEAGERPAGAHAEATLYDSKGNRIVN